MAIWSFFGAFLEVFYRSKTPNRVYNRLMLNVSEDQEGNRSMSLHVIPKKHKLLKATPKAQSCVLVLWGEYFDEIAAATFIATLRQAGLCVRVVGVHGLLAAGRNGLVLHADLTLSEVKALLPNVFCVILPCGRAAVKRLENDPRIHELFAAIAHNDAKVVVYDEGVRRQTLIRCHAIPNQAIVAYPHDANLTAFAQEMGRTLARNIADHPERIFPL
ncbi:MAG: hypothetical protein DYG89_40870 [Caldilinea sp. CFX5]|nr:hypothetical protein [Caldilinea sp. CFX5]